MTELKLVRNVEDNQKLRDSFNELATKVFGISFEDWYVKGFWTDKYKPFCYVDNGKVIANVSVNKIDLIIYGKKRRALQIGTVMTHPEYRNQGLSRKLMNEVLDTYQGEYDVMYLFANHTVLDFYPKFGFQAMDEHIFSMDYKLSFDQQEKKTRKLDGTNLEDLQFIYNFAECRIPVSQTLSTANTQELLMFYGLYVFSHDIYYLENTQVIAIYKNEDTELHIYDLIAQDEYDIKQVLSQIATPNTKKIVFHYTPDYKDLEIERTVYHGDDQLFVKLQDSIQLPEKFKHPITSKA
jgi:predicted N-acetyltransferase YhbS